MRKFLMTSVAVLALAGSAVARDGALFIGNQDYDSFRTMRGGGALLDAADAFRDLGFAVWSGEDVTGGDMIGMLTLFVRDSIDADRVLVILSGRYLHSVNESWLLGVDSSSVPALGTLPSEAVPLSTVLAVLAGHPGKALLMIADDNDRGDSGSPYLENGLGDLDIPAGVTVFRGGARSIAGFAADVLPLPALSRTVQAAKRQGLATSGFLPRDYRFLDGVEVVATSEGAALDEDGAWRVVRLADTLPAYQGYLRDFADGEHVAEVMAYIEEIRTEPLRADRLLEEAIGLGREQRKEIQRDLSILDFNPRGIDGIFGPGSRGAITAWQQDAGYDGTGYLTRDQLSRLDAQGERRAIELEAEAEKRRLEEERRDRAYWRDTGKAGDEAGLRAYLKQFPDGVFAEVAQNRLEVFEEQKRQDAAVQERQDWDAVSQAGTLDAYRQYLSVYPDGAFVADAQAKVEELSDAEGSKELTAAKRGEERLKLNGQTRALVENRLQSLGLKPGPADGKFDKSTRRAIRRYQKARKLPVTGYLSQDTVVRLLADSLFR